MKGFLNWCTRYTKNKIYKIIFFIILFLLISYLTNACDVHATTYLSQDTARIYTESQKCTTNNNSLSCSKGTAYKFQYDYNTTKSGDSYQFDMILNNNQYSQLFQNIIYDYSISDTFTVDSTHRSLYILLPYSSSQFAVSGSGSSGTNFTINMFPQNSLNPDTEEIDRHFTFPMNYNFKPYYCSYVDVLDNQTKPCNVILDIASGNVWKFIADIPLGTTINKITFYFGTNQIYSGSLKTQTYGVYNIQIPDNENIGYLHTASSSATLYDIFYVNYNTWRQRSNLNNIGVWYYPQGYIIQTPKFSVPNNSFELGYDSTDYTGNTYKWNYTNLSSSQLEQLNSTINNIEQDIINQQGNDNWFDDTMEGFRSSEQASSFTNLFTALFSYPFQKLSSLSNEPLFTNQGGPNLAVCTGRNLVGGIPENRLKIPVFNNVSWDIPCIHYDFYTHLKSGDFAFYPTTIDGITITSGGSNSLYPIIRLILRGVLVYILFLNVIDIYKYILDSDRKEIETLDL